MHLGDRVVRAYLAAWEGAPEQSQPLTAMLRGAIVNVNAIARLRDFIQARLTHGQHANQRRRHASCRLASSRLVGIISGRRIIAVPTLAAADTEELVAVLGPAIQQILVL